MIEGSPADLDPTDGASEAIQCLSNGRTLVSIVFRLLELLVKTMLFKETSD